MKPLKVLLFSFCFVILSNSQSKAQKVFATNYTYQAELKVFVVAQEYQADLKVYKVRNEYQAIGQNGKWFFTKYDYQAKKKIFFVDHEMRRQRYPHGDRHTDPPGRTQQHREYRILRHF